MLCQNSTNKSFCQKIQNFVHFGPYDLVQILLACDPSMHQITYTEALNSNVII